MTDRNRQRLAELMEARRGELRLTWREVAERGGVTEETLRQVRLGTGKIRRLTKRAIEDGLRWQHDSVDRVLLADGEPTPIEEAGLPMDETSRARRVSILFATPEQLVEMRQAVEEVLGREKADEFLRGALELREQNRPG